MIVTVTLRMSLISEQMDSVGKPRSMNEKGHPRTFMKHVLSYLCTFTAMESSKFKFDYTKKCYFKRNLSTRHRRFTDYISS